ncbi:aromatase/cyclase [Spirillospora sp. CA-294931]|uniref:aromatase/cyclase n=1 Tax=Spirillospora sp. CA-294931 TaxID=3240042 RepID=UPI003D8A493C
MERSGHREVEHEIEIGAPAATVYRMIAGVGDWPRLFPPTVHVEHLEHSERAERIRIWAFANGEVKNWTSRRALDPARLRVEFRQEVSAPPVAAMGGTWVIEPLSEARSRVRLLHDYRAIGDDPADLEWIERAVDGNSRSELAALRTNVETAAGADDRLTFSFEDSITVEGPPEKAAASVYDFLNEAGLWEERLPHVTRVVLTEDTPGLQILEMDTTAKNGSTHTTRSVRVCFPHHKIVYKQITLPALLGLHTGCWRIEPRPGEDAVTVTSVHTVSVNEANLVTVLGEGATVDRARQFLRDALGANSRATLGHAKEFAESRT